MNKNTVVAVVVGAVFGFLVACGNEYGDCGRGNTECLLAQAQAEADAENRDIYVDVDVFVSNYVDVDTDINLQQNQTSGCTTCVPTPPTVVDAGRPDPMVCRDMCDKYKVSCRKKKTCLHTTRVCKRQSEW